jgi:ankyrin repeat protein
MDSSFKATINMISEYGVWKIKNEEIGADIDMSALGFISEIGKAIKGKGNMDNLSDTGMTLMLIGAAQEGHTETVLALLLGGGDMNGKASDGSTALMRAAQQGHIDTVLTLLALGTDVNAEANDGSTALEKAKEGGYEEVFRLLKRAGAKK